MLDWVNSLCNTMDTKGTRMSLPAADTSKQPDNRTTMELGAVLPLTAEVRDEHLFVGGVDMVELAREQGTALYVMDERDMRTRMETYLEAFRSRYGNADVVYASKAFLNKEAARIVNEEGLCLDVSGGGELACALATGFPAERIELVRDYEKLLGEIAADAAPAFIMPTYTAMFDLRGEIGRHTDVKAFYE